MKTESKFIYQKNELYIWKLVRLSMRSKINKNAVFCEKYITKLYEFWKN